LRGGQVGDNLFAGQTFRRDATARVNIKKPDFSWRFAVVAFTVTGFAGGIIRQSTLRSRGVVA